jgi:23S rRNA (adenine2503-C2)-methyltransferase
VKILNKKCIRDLSLEEIEKWLTENGEKKFRGKQIFKWIGTGASSFDDMTDLSKDLRTKMSGFFDLDNVRIADCLISKDDTRKYLLELHDGNVIESVLMKYSYGYTICISTQVGCRMGCSFCASTVDGMERNLTPGEMIGQILAVQNDLRKVNKDARISRVVLMGSGEPLDNFDNTVKFLALVNHELGLHISHRNITLSTCGIAPRIRELADMDLQITLAVSFHAYDDSVRSRLMPINRKYPIEEVLEAADYYFATTKRRVTFEYALIKGENDSLEGATKLGELMRGHGIHVNLIPVNKVEEKGYEPSAEKSISSFRNELKRFGVETTVRRELGSDINAACGQLRKKHLSTMNQ